jgi:multicomponent Na+:H+ antiporter subunit D
VSWSTSLLVPLPVVLPLLAAGIKLTIGPRLPYVHRVISVGTLALVLGVGIALLVLAEQDGPQVAAIGGWQPPLGIALVADRLSALMIVVSSAVTLCVLVYSYGQGAADGEESLPLAVFHPTFLVLCAGVSNAFLAGDLFNLYVGFEILLVSSYVLLTLGGTSSRIRSGTTYVVVSILSSLLFLGAIGLVYGAAGSLNLADLAGRIDRLDGGIALVLEVALLSAFAIKAAVFPLSAWLPDSYPTAPAPVTAVFAGLLTMVVGILGAVAQTDVKRMLSFTLVSHIGYMVFGVALGSRLGLAGAVFYVVHHITVQTTLFLTAGMIERRAGSTSSERVGGLARTAPLVAVLFFLPAMNLAGIPPFSGFLGKVALIQAGVVDGTALAWVLVAGSVVTSLLTLYAVGKVWSRVFWRAPRVALPTADGPRGREGQDEVVGATIGGRTITTSTAMPVTMTGATVAMVVLGLAYTAAAGPLMRYSDRAAGELRDRQAYVQAVDPEMVRPVERAGAGNP